MHQRTNLHLRKTHAEAGVRATAERNIGVAVLLVLLARRRKTLGVDSVSIDGNPLRDPPGEVTAFQLTGIP